ncbi:MAG: leucyl/phenylalanyl-tRNA--protein transferase [Ignavibacteria bacterium RIFOXYB2_FULL_35_12]|nr:MAG: leucyl/phenylalanyl-tRNA--protein transferase [Ignavibacteria bacterium GWA2_36_19]OGU60941.1 MAG: leucyl/phenylalanyl-tRNA--protein transferase [Ignavibacteria bacterium GWF2_35_20]OGU91976.1 MAG: leucyl/phenylalanyl-tRNA--protein transferase [Ignavibacteria bacterium RIFOXYA12_FULL_35_25]OGU92516.1 MAG: leucyl/phenylalanyl-tRNA--protein transferase [Ignavibacteria bacterium RIFOXYC12_FULL_35_11]OGU93469.1 MAG: leucyl/phenylalanyl-tRNA--protein transferase [Ignavibacteria bacterium RIF
MSSKKEFSYKEYLEPEMMLQLYSQGAFPMADEKTGIINWYLPEKRTIIPLNNYNYPRSLKKAISDFNFEFKFDTDFISVVDICANRKPTWISEELIEAYLRLDKLGFIHTVETWQKEKLVGGLYGVTIRGAFFGESMFSKVSQASKAALIKLIEHLNKRKFVLLDVQYITPHLKMFGAIEISFEQYEALLAKAYKADCRF